MTRCGAPIAAAAGCVSKPPGVLLFDLACGVLALVRASSRRSGEVERTAVNHAIISKLKLATTPLHSRG